MKTLILAILLAAFCLCSCNKSDNLKHQNSINQNDLLVSNLDKQIDISNKQTTLIIETNSTLKEFMNVSIQQFQQQQEFNERFLSKLDEIAKKS